METGWSDSPVWRQSAKVCALREVLGAFAQEPATGPTPFFSLTLDR